MTAAAAAAAATCRIEFHAQVRNMALAPLYSHYASSRNSPTPGTNSSSSSSSRPVAPGAVPWDPNYVVFLNDVFFCWSMVLRLMGYRADITCGMDFWQNRGEPVHICVRRDRHWRCGLSSGPQKCLGASHSVRDHTKLVTGCQGRAWALVHCCALPALQMPQLSCRMSSAAKASCPSLPCLLRHTAVRSAACAAAVSLVHCSATAGSSCVLCRIWWAQCT
jgi:hypothetical protein